MKLRLLLMTLPLWLILVCAQAQDLNWERL